MIAATFVVLFSIVGICATEPTWTTLRVTWGLNVLSKHVYAKLPLTTSETAEYGFHEIREGCADGKFRGRRYIKDNDPAVILIYDSKGFVAGIQSGLPIYEVDRVKTTYPFSSNPIFQLFDDTYFRTVYFMDPSYICKSNRTKKEFKNNIGTGLWIQNGSNPNVNLIKVPIKKDELKSTKWTKGKCFVSMGRHYWHDVKKDMSCDNFFPYFLLLNRGKLTGFGFASVGNFEFSTRFEHPKKQDFSKFFDPVPQCLENEFDQTGGFSTMHVFFSVRAWNLAC
uniref:Venom protein n=1 Tax=Hadrurus spadix TaxID=141984 RepID=A0A1W7R968_9SCOR